MRFHELLDTLRVAYRQRDFARCDSLLDEFIEKAQGDELAEALGRKADIIVESNSRRGAEGLVLVDEALTHAGDPQLAIRLLTAGLALCYVMGDCEKAMRFETLSHHLLQQLPDDSPARSSQFRLHGNLGLIAALRGEHATSYWHFLQAVFGLNTYGSDDDSDIRCWLFWAYRRVAETCITMNRQPEAEEALAKAQACILSDTMLAGWKLTQVHLVSQSGRPEEATALLENITPNDSWTPDLHVEYHLLAGLVAQSSGDLRGFHTHVSRAHDKAVEQRLDYWLCKIQRVQRTPVGLGAAK